MTKKERIIKLINSQETDYTPHHFDMTMRITDMLGNYYGYGRDDVEDFIGNHFLYVDFSAPDNKDSGYHGNSGEEHIIIDEFGVTWDLSKTYDVGDWGIVDSPVKNLELDGYIFPGGGGTGRFEKAKQLMSRYTDRFNVLRMTGLLDSSWHITGLQDFLMAMVLDEKLTCTILDNVTEYMLGVIEQIPEGIDAVRFIEDWGVQKGLLFSKKDWIKYLKPRLRQLHAACRKKGLYVMHHSCGDITELFPEIIDLGVDIIDAVQPEAMDIRFIKKEYGRDIVLFGGLGAQSTLPGGTPEDVIKEAAETLKILGEGGKYIVGPAGSISTDTPLTNVIALTEFCMNLKNIG